MWSWDFANPGSCKTMMSLYLVDPLHPVTLMFLVPQISALLKLEHLLKISITINDSIIFVDLKTSSLYWFLHIAYYYRNSFNMM